MQTYCWPNACGGQWGDTGGGVCLSSFFVVFFFFSFSILTFFFLHREHCTGAVEGPLGLKAHGVHWATDVSVLGEEKEEKEEKEEGEKKEKKIFNLIFTTKLTNFIPFFSLRYNKKNKVLFFCKKKKAKIHKYIEPQGWKQNIGREGKVSRLQWQSAEKRSAARPPDSNMAAIHFNVDAQLARTPKKFLTSAWEGTIEPPALHTTPL